MPNRLSQWASRFGVVGLTKTVAMDLGPRNVRVNVVVPGMIHTPMTQPLFDGPDTVKRIRADHPIGREGRPEQKQYEDS